MPSFGTLGQLLPIFVSKEASGPQTELPKAGILGILDTEEHFQK